MGMLKNIEAGVLALGMTFSAHAQADEQSLQQNFCSASNSYGARSWQALSYVDAKSHGGSNYYMMNQEEREQKIVAQLRFAPQHLKGTMKDNMIAQYRSFDLLTEQAKKVKLLSELGHHGVTLQNLESWEQRCP